MPRTYVTPKMTDKHRLESFESGICPYCNAQDITSESSEKKIGPYRYRESWYKCLQCSAEGTFREKVKK